MPTDFGSFLHIFPFSNFLRLQTNCTVYLQPKHDIRGFSVTNSSSKLILILDFIPLKHRNLYSVHDVINVQNHPGLN